MGTPLSRRAFLETASIGAAGLVGGEQHQLRALPLPRVVAGDAVQVGGETGRRARTPEIAQRIHAHHRDTGLGQRAGNLLVQPGPAAIAGNEHGEGVAIAGSRHFHQRQAVQLVRHRRQAHPALRAQYPRRGDLARGADRQPRGPGRRLGARRCRPLCGRPVLRDGVHGARRGLRPHRPGQERCGADPAGGPECRGRCGCRHRGARARRRQRGLHPRRPDGRVRRAIQYRADAVRGNRARRRSAGRGVGAASCREPSRLERRSYQDGGAAR